MAAPAIEATGLVKTFGAFTALDGVDLTLPRGAVTAVLGPNGAGKTTTVRILTTLTAATAGTAIVAGFDVATHAHEVRRRIGLAAQDATVDHLLTGFENLVMVGELHQLPRREARDRARQLLETFALTDAADRRTEHYSGGMRRRLDLAVTLVANPEILFLDEPTTGLDPRARAELWDVIESLVDTGVSVLLTTQYLEEAERLADDILVVDHGHIIASGNARDLKRQLGRDRIGVTVIDSARLDEAGDILRRVCATEVEIDRSVRTITAPTSTGLGGLTTVAHALDDAGIEVEDLALRQPTLDEVFLALTGRPAE
ncbi:MAG: ATP-binding cassette domain-containing protein [Actinobacteria bacterium]|nr:ATP-binding cassette domain-containing protein [Actinomycetota bacterium]